MNLVSAVSLSLSTLPNQECALPLRPLRNSRRQRGCCASGHACSRALSTLRCRCATTTMILLSVIVIIPRRMSSLPQNLFTNRIGNRGLRPHSLNPCRRVEHQDIRNRPRLLPAIRQRSGSQDSLDWMRRFAHSRDYHPRPQAWRGLRPPQHRQHHHRYRHQFALRHRVRRRTPESRAHPCLRPH